MRYIFFLLIFCTIVIIQACVPEKTAVMCTMEFRTIGVIVNGANLDDVFTIRVKTGDTLRFANGGFQSNYYIVLDDNFQKIIERKSEPFLFVGKENGELRVSETFVIKADECHIDKVSGPEVINL